MTFEAPQTNFESNDSFSSPIVTEVKPAELDGLELEAAFKAGAILDEELTTSQRTYLNNAGYTVKPPQGEVTLH